MLKISYSLGNSLKYLKKCSEAIEIYDKAIKLNPNLSVIYNNKGKNNNKI